MTYFGKKYRTDSKQGKEGSVCQSRVNDEIKDGGSDMSR